MKALKSARTLAASLGVLAVGALAATPAMAFDVVDWNWYKNKYQTEYINVNIDIDLESTGLVELEKLQVFLGNSNAYAGTFWIENNQFDPGGSYRDVYYYCYCRTKVWVPNAISAVDHLPSVVTAASAFGNIQVITSDVPVFLHDGQFTANVAEYDRSKYGDFLFALGVYGSGYGLGNTHTDLAKAFTLGAAFGVLSPSYISAWADTAYIKNASVDNSATAAANLIQVNLKSDVDGSTLVTSSCGYYCTDTDRLSNHVVQADITQFAYADVSAVANVWGVSVDNYNNLGKSFDKPLVNNVATSIGNGVIINVGK